MESQEAHTSSPQRSRTLHAGRFSLSGGMGLLVHGGAWDIPAEESEAHRDGLQAALAVGRRLLLDGADALEVACETVAVMEAYGAFDAGCGAVLTRDGSVELDAGAMDGTRRAYGAVAGVRRLVQPVRVAGLLARDPSRQACFLAGEPAERFAAAHGMDLVTNASLITPRERRRYERIRGEADAYHTSHPFLPEAKRAPQGTVGCVARDPRGGLAAATSTGGTPYRMPGRIGDSPLPGAGYYASPAAAASATGWGEAIAAVLLCGRAVDAVEHGRSAGEVAVEGLVSMHARIRNEEGHGATGGVILLVADGEGAWAFTTPRMARGGWREGEAPWASVGPDGFDTPDAFTGTFTDAGT